MSINDFDCDQRPLSSRFTYLGEPLPEVLLCKQSESGTAEAGPLLHGGLVGRGGRNAVLLHRPPQPLGHVRLAPKGRVWNWMRGRI